MSKFTRYALDDYDGVVKSDNGWLYHECEVDPYIESLQTELEEMYSKIEEAFRDGWSAGNTQYTEWTLEIEVKEYMQALKQKEE